MAFTFSCDGTVTRINPAKNQQGHSYMTLLQGGLISESFVVADSVLSGVGSGQQVKVTGYMEYRVFGGTVTKAAVATSIDVLEDAKPDLVFGKPEAAGGATAQRPEAKRGLTAAAT